MNTVSIRIAMLTTMAAASAAAQSTVRVPLQPGLERKPAADFALRDVAGKTAKLKQYRGKVLLLDFWATWCTGCKAPHLPLGEAVYLGFLATRSDIRMIKTKRATINRNSHGPRDESQMNPNIAFLTPCSC